MEKKGFIETNAKVAYCNKKLRQVGEYLFEWRFEMFYNEYVWYIKRARKLSSSQVEALRDPTRLESVHGSGWKANIDAVTVGSGIVCCTTYGSYYCMLKRMDELYEVLKNNE